MEQIFEKIESTDLRPIREIVLERLRKAIMNGTFQTGDRLVETSIAEKMGVSRTPVREAFRQLEIEGLAENLPRKGTIVKGISKRDIFEIYEIREVLEGLAFRLACSNITDEQILELKEKLEKMRACIENGDIKKYWEFHGEFHNSILYSSGNQRLIDQMKQIYEYLSKLRNFTLVMNKRRSIAMEEHKALIEAFEKRDEVLAEQIGRRHTLNAEKFLSKEFHLS
ncbi:GntR family transcriptional regulator [Clostridium saccharobutylicum]|uniref:Transcriptional regulator, GntR family n=1 Tax=Clostridium saccharobutylicum DSM 13864 TaxID=1345695 RepID=U5MXV7_CLOSA|nr:GntR family transcriptional regulator [Clostridium saccharobutylicum]AGX44451.1 transcriptional regulator, GntR family [Clostridium saccharobutylicum DSM 13864]AQR91746.1 HTH-type transcriptional regulator McbR [Clostridium saccharobutylicum]AQS01648.1 HTH-type transcriptional regulator McbR [Clostridium saccharobutylicum]AQS11258.1 HTH-type transcriptional regulator McbR [Clostridium saccharobutylicum]AQS15631.1 HTH-type transcriptional regulator McbR [Clostridium saccharobutylicum]